MRALAAKGIPFAVVVGLAFAAAAGGILWHRATPAVQVINRSSARVENCILRVGDREVHVGAVDAGAMVAASLGGTGRVRAECRLASGSELATDAGLHAGWFDRIVLAVGVSDITLRRRGS